MTNRIIILALASLACVYTLLPIPVAAHVLKVDGTIGAVLHIDPEDDPIIGQPAHLYFNISDTDKKFHPDNCTCLLTIANNNSKILFKSGLVIAGDALEAQTIFPEPNIYTIVIKGIPKTQNGFQAFSLQYEIRVARESGISSVHIHSATGLLGGHGLHGIILGGGICVVIAMIIQEQLKQRGRV